MRNLDLIGQAEPIMGDARRARPEDRDRSLETVVAAFATDPLLRWVWPDDDRYAECGPAFFGLLLDLRLEGGEVWVVDEGAAVAMWNPPGGLYGVSPSGRWDALRKGFTEAERAKWDVTDSRLAVPKGTPPHWYLGVLATQPERQGQGLGRAVVAPILTAADRIGMDAYLETAKEANLGFYRACGFEVAHETDLPDGGPRCWLMHRRPEQP